MNISSRSARITDPTVHQSPAYAAAKTAVLFHCSDESSYITGATLDCNGGSFMPS